jgi:NTE family protein
MWINRTSLRRVGSCVTAVLAMVLSGCARIDNLPLNAQAIQPNINFDTPAPISLTAYSQGDDDRLIAVMLSGGGSRAAAFGWGTLTELAAITRGSGTLADRVGVVSGVSAGAILGASFVLNGPEALPHFRKRFLDVNVEGALRNALVPTNIFRALNGGINDRKGLPEWLAANLYGKATLGDINGARKPRLLLHATDLQNRAPFLFDPTSFNTICSDRNSFPLSEAVAASAAVPVIFAPMILQNYRDTCAFGPSSVPDAPRKKEQVSELDAHLQRTRAQYGNAAENKFIKLNDGGLVDNLGTQGLILASNRKGSKAAPFDADRAYRAKRILFLVVDGSTREGNGINASLASPGLVNTVRSAVDAMIDTSSRQSLDTMRRWLPVWRDGLIAERCKRGLADCRNLKVDFARIALEDLTDPVDLKKFSDSNTSLNLTPEMVDFFAGSAVELLRQNTVFQSFIR